MEGFEGLVNRYIGHLGMKDYSDSTIQAGQYRVLKFFEYLSLEGMNEVSNITRKIIQDYRLYLYHQGFKGSTVYALLTSLRSFFSYLRRENLILYDPTKDLELPKERRSLPKDIMTHKEITRILSIPNTETKVGLRDRAILELLYSTGIRMGELLSLDIFDIDLSEGILTVRKGKFGKERRVPIGSVAQGYLKRYLLEIRPGLLKTSKQKALFLSSIEGERLSKVTIARMISDYRKMAQIQKKITCHSFRHTCATHMLIGGAKIRYIQELLGHSHISSTQIYTRVAIEDLKAIHLRCHPRGRKG
jgi:integrase/recombinase XerD